MYGYGWFDRAPQDPIPGPCQCPCACKKPNSYEVYKRFTKVGEVKFFVCRGCLSELTGTWALIWETWETQQPQ